MSPKTSKKYITYKSEAAPFFFYIDIFPLDLSQYEIPHHGELLKEVQSNPIMPLPLRIDRVYSGKSSILIRPKDPISFSVNENMAISNLQPFVQSGIKKLLYFTEVRFL